MPATRHQSIVEKALEELKRDPMALPYLAPLRVAVNRRRIRCYQGITISSGRLYYTPEIVGEMSTEEIKGEILSLILPRIVRDLLGKETSL